MAFFGSIYKIEFPSITTTSLEQRAKEHETLFISIFLQRKREREKERESKKKEDGIIYTIMTASSVLPVTIYKGKLYFLFGLENEFEDSAKGFSDFGGGVENGENIRQTALREGGEELTGFLGDGNRLEEHMRKNGGSLQLSFNDYHIRVFYLKYDPNLPKYYNWNHAFLWERMNKKMLSKTKLFEKIEIQWFSVNRINARIKEFRSFYQDIVKQLIGPLVKPKILAFIKKCAKKHRTTRGRTQRNKKSKRTRKK